jgi:hypothetical protein
MTRPLLAVALLMLLAACNGAAPGDDSRAASGEVLEGTVSDSMLPVDRVQSEPPLEDPDAFAEAQEKAAQTASGEGAAAPTEGEAPEAAAAEPSETAAAPPPEPAD